MENFSPDIEAHITAIRTGLAEHRQKAIHELMMIDSEESIRALVNIVDDMWQKSGFWEIVDYLESHKLIDATPFVMRVLVGKEKIYEFDYQGASKRIHLIKSEALNYEDILAILRRNQKQSIGLLVQVLGQVQSDESNYFLTRILKEFPDDGVRSLALGALLLDKKPPILKPVFDVLENDSLSYQNSERAFFIIGEFLKNHTLEDETRFLNILKNYYLRDFNSPERLKEILDNMTVDTNQQLEIWKQEYDLHQENRYSIFR